MTTYFLVAAGFGILGYAIRYMVGQVDMLRDFKFRIYVDKKEKLFVAKKYIRERWSDGLAEFNCVDLEEDKSHTMRR